MPDLRELRGLRASDRTWEEKRAIDDVMGYQTTDTLPDITYKPIEKNESIPPKFNADSSSAQFLNQTIKYKEHLDSEYAKALEKTSQNYNVQYTNAVSSLANAKFDEVANQVSSYYKRYKGTDKLTITDVEKKQLMAEYDARFNAYGEENAAIWLDKQIKENVANNQSWWEQGMHAVSHLIPAIEGGAIQAFGNIYGAFNYIFRDVNDAIERAETHQSPDLNWWDGFLDSTLDNPITRYGRDVEHAGASNIVQGLFHLIDSDVETAGERIARTKASATKYNPEGIGNDMIVTTEEQDNSLLSSATPWQALQSGGFTALSMMVGAGEAKVANWIFRGATRGMNALNKAEKLIKTAEGLEKGLVGLKKAQNFTDVFIIPASVGTMEGAIEGLNTKIDVERKAVEQLDDFYREKITKEAKETGQSFEDVWKKYESQYIESRRQIDWASSKAGIHNFYANSLINGLINQTLKAGIMAPRVQEALRNSRLTGWAYRNPKFQVNPETNVVTPKTSAFGKVVQVLKEPAGEGLEEYAQSLSNDVFSGAAENNINEFIQNKFNGDGTAKVTDSFGSDYAAALTALGESLTNKESIESAILGAVSSTMGTVGGIGRGYHRDANGNLVKNSLLDPRNLTRGLDSEGNHEGWTDYLRRVTPWRSGAINAYFDQRKEQAEANETAAQLTEWLQDPQNKGKWDGLTGTANWITQMENAAESNDQFSYRKAQMGKAINDIFMLKKLEGTDFHETLMADLQRAANGEMSQEEIQKLKENGGEDYQNVSDQEIVEKIQSNANRMLGLMTQVETESRNLDRLMGRMDEDTKQSLIFGKIMEKDFTERRDQLQQEIDTIKSRIQNSRSSNISNGLEQNLAQLMVRYGSLNHALHEQSRLQEEKEKTEKKVEELEAIDPSKTSDKQKEDLIKSRNRLKKINQELNGFDALYQRDENGKKTDQIDSSLALMVLNEKDIMDLGPVTRAVVLAQGAAKLYNTTHQNRQRVDQLNLEINDIQHQIDALEAQKAGWMTQDGRIKKGHNKQAARNNKKIAELQTEKEKKMRQLDAEQGRQNTKSIYSQQQQEVIDNLVRQGIALDADFLDKVVDMGRLEKGIRDYHQQYQAILSDPKAFQNYVQRAKYNAQRDLTRRRAERIAGIQSFQEYSQELDRLTANASQQEMNEIMAALRSEDARQKRQMQRNNMVVDPETGDLVPSQEPIQTNLDRYLENISKQADLMIQFAKNPNLTDNDQSLLMDAMQYLSSKGIDVTDREAAVEALIERDEQGNQGGKFRQFVEAKNDAMLPQQRTFMARRSPNEGTVFTTIGQIVSQYVDLVNEKQQDDINKGNMQPTMAPAQPAPTATASAASPQPAPTSTQQGVVTPSSPTPPTAQPGGSIFDIVGGTTPEAGHFVDGDGTVATGAQTQSMQQRQEQQQAGVNKTAIQQMFENVTTPEIAKMVSDASGIIDNSNAQVSVTDLARQYLVELAVNNDETYPMLDDLMTAIQTQINRLRNMADRQDDPQENDFNKAAGLLQGVYGSLNAKKLRGRRRTAPMPSSRPENPRAAWIHTANIGFMQQKNPDAWAVRFTDEHNIDGWNREHTISRTEPVYFITDSTWSAEVMGQMATGDGRKYDTLTDMPVVAAVKVEAPQNTATTTAIEINGQWYQPIGVMPSSKSQSQGAAMTEEIRRVASKEQGRHLVTANGLPNSAPLITHVHGVNYLTGHHPDAATQTDRQNAEENNSEVSELILRDFVGDMYGQQEVDRLRSLSKEEMLNDPVYQEARSKFLNGLSWNGEGSGVYKNQITFTPENHRSGETGNPMIIFTVPMAQTTGRTTNQTLPEVLANGSAEQVITFNSRTERLYHEIIRPLFQYLPMKDRRGDKSAKLITQDDVTANPNIYQEEADRLTKMLNGFDGSEGSRGMGGVSNFLYINRNNGWSIKVTAPKALQVASDLDSSQTVFKVFFVNNNPKIAPIELGEIRANQNDTGSAMELVRNIMWDSQTNQVRDFLNWQVPKADAQNLKNPDAGRSGQSRRNYAAIVDDGILTIAGSALTYDIDGVKLNAPITTDGQRHTSIVYPQDTVSNADNAQPGSPQNITPQGDGAVVAGDGNQVLGDSGAVLGEGSNGFLPPTPPRRNPNLERAEATTRKIIADSASFRLSEDETYYYIKDNVTGEETKYLRVTTVIGADESAPQWNPSTEDILNKLRERHSISSDAYLERYKDTQDMSQKLNIPVGEIRRAVAELRTEHKKEKYGAWGTPSTAVGNTADIITRDFLAGHLKESYPNITKTALDMFVQDLTIFKNNLEVLGIHIVPEEVMAHGKITMTDSDGKQHQVNVAGTLDLFGYDDNGNYYIFDMKTTRNKSQGKLLQEKDKWSRQISMYADLLKQSYGIDVKPENLRIIPINVDYPTPMGSRNDHLDPAGPQYSVNDNGQLLLTYRGKTEDKPFDGSNLAMRGHTLAEQFQPGYTPFNINWDNLSSEDQDIADALAAQSGQAGQNTSGEAPAIAQIETPQRRGPSFMNMGDIRFSETQDAAPATAPVVPNGQSEILPQWRRLSNAVKAFLQENYGIEGVNDYNDMLNDPAFAESIQHDLKCHSLI